MMSISKKQFIANNKYILKHFCKHEISIGISCLSLDNKRVVAWSDRTDKLSKSSHDFVIFKLDSIGTIYDLVNGLDDYCEYL